VSNPSLFKRLGPAGPIALAAVILPLVGWLVIPSNMDRIAPWLREHRAEGLAIYLAGFVLLTGLALMPTHLLAALGGFAFGMAWGVPASVLGFVLGAALGYEIARLASKGRVLQIIDDNPRWRAVKLALLGERQSFGRTLWMVTLTRLPLTPFAAVNLLHAGVGVARGPYLLGTLLGMTPRTVLAVFIGAGLGETFSPEAVKSGSPAWVMWTGIAITGAVVMYVGHLASRAIDRLAAQQEQPEDPPAA